MRENRSIDLEKNSATGVLNGVYSKSRTMKTELKFRLKTRAQMVVSGVNDHLNRFNELKILDFGAAEGKTLLEMRRSLQDCFFMGVEFSEELLSEAQELPEQVRLIKGDVCCLPNEIKDNSFEIVTALACLEHLVNPLAAIKEAVRVLKPNGLFIATCPVPCWDNLACKVGLLQSEQHEKELTKKALIAFVQKAGLDLVEFRRFMWAPVSFLPYLNIRVPVKAALKLDRSIERLRMFNWLFVNQCIVAKKNRKDRLV